MGGVFGAVAAIALIVVGYILYRRRARTQARNLAWSPAKRPRSNSLFSAPVSSIIGTRLISNPTPATRGRTPTPSDSHSPTLSEAAPEMAEMGMGMMPRMNLGPDLGMSIGMRTMGSGQGSSLAPPGQSMARPVMISPRLMVNNFPGSHDSGISAGMKDEDPFADPGMVPMQRVSPPYGGDLLESPTIRPEGARNSMGSEVYLRNPFMSPTEAPYDTGDVQRFSTLSGASGPIEVRYGTACILLGASLSDDILSTQPGYAM